jgi:hypothetical protein
VTEIPNDELHRLPQQGATVIGTSAFPSIGHRMELLVVSQNIGGKETVARFSMTFFSTQVTNSLSLNANEL